MPAVPETYGIVADSPHPNAAKLFMDWFLSPVGQKALAEALALHSPREDVPPPPGAVPLTKMKLLVPADWTPSRRTARALPRNGPHRRRAALSLSPSLATSSPPPGGEVG